MGSGFFVAPNKLHHNIDRAKHRAAQNGTEKATRDHVGLLGGCFGRDRRGFDGVFARQFDGSHRLDASGHGDEVGRSILEDVHCGHPARSDSLGGGLFLAPTCFLRPIVSGKCPEEGFGFEPLKRSLVETSPGLGHHQFRRHCDSLFFDGRAHRREPRASMGHRSVSVARRHRDAVDRPAVLSDGQYSRDRADDPSAGDFHRSGADPRGDVSWNEPIDGDDCWWSDHGSVASCSVGV